MNKNTDLVLKDSDQMNTALVAARNTEERLVIAQQMILHPKGLNSANNTNNSPPIVALC